MNGFQFPWVIGCGGKEAPFHFNGKRYIYVFNTVERKHYFYCYDDDIFIRDADFYAMKQTEEQRRMFSALKSGVRL